MWLSEKAAVSGAENRSPAQLAEVSIGGALAAAVGEGESRGLTVIAPGGVLWKPVAGQTALCVDCADGAAALAGVCESDYPAGMASGELLLRSRTGAAVWLKNDGSIVLTGDVSVVGTLRLNGASVAVEP